MKNKDFVKIATLFVEALQAAMGTLIVGQPGSGKSALIKRMMKCCLKMLDGRNKARIVALDLAGELVEFVYGWANLATPIRILSPHDLRGCAIDFAADVTNEMAVKEFCSKVVVHVANDPQPFFNNSARALLSGAVSLFNFTAPGKWTLRDAIVFLDNKAAARMVFQKFPQFAHALSHLQENDGARDVYATLLSRFDSLRPIAAAWDKAKSRVSISQIATHEGVTIMGYDFRFAEGLTAIYAYIFDNLADHALARQSREECTFLFLDEIRQIRPLQAFNRLATLGRKAGVALIAAIQSLHGLDQVYTEKLAREALSCNQHVILLKMGDWETATWGSHLLGESEVIEWVKPDRYHPQPQRNVKMRPNVLPSELMQLPLADFSRDLIKGYLVHEGHAQLFRTGLRDDVLLPPGHLEVPNLMLRPPEDFILEPFNVRDFERLKLPLDLLNDSEFLNHL